MLLSRTSLQGRKNPSQERFPATGRWAEEAGTAAAGIHCKRRGRKACLGVALPTASWEADSLLRTGVSCAPDAAFSKQDRGPRKEAQQLGLADLEAT